MPPFSRRYLFADESGNFDFSGGRGASRYFILTTVALSDCAVGDGLLALRRELEWEGMGLDTEFLATTDSYHVRERVFAAVAPHEFRVDATVIEKAHVPELVRASDVALYGAAWTMHLQRVLPRSLEPDDELLVVGASLGTRRRRSAFRDAIITAVDAARASVTCRVASWLGASDPRLQLADYCCWVVQRTWEAGDLRPRARILARLASEEVARLATETARPESEGT